MTLYARYSYEETSHLTLLSKKVNDVGLRNLHIRVAHVQIYCYVSFQKTEVQIRISLIGFIKLQIKKLTRTN
jgi:hypothetical protein